MKNTIIILALIQSIFSWNGTVNITMETLDNFGSAMPVMSLVSGNKFDTITFNDKTQLQTIKVNNITFNILYVLDDSNIVLGRANINEPFNPPYYNINLNLTAIERKTPIIRTYQTSTHYYDIKGCKYSKIPNKSGIYIHKNKKIFILK